MAVDFKKERAISYINKDFQSFKRDLIKFSQAHHSGVLQDFNESSPNMALLEHVAFVSDVLSFYMDQQFLEMDMVRARQLENVVAIAKSHGYRPLGKRAARGYLTVYSEIPSTLNARGETVPDDSFMPILRMGSSFGGPDGSVFETLEDCYFSSSLGRMVTGSVFDSVSGLPTYFAIKKTVPIVAGETKTESFTITTFEQFKEIELTYPDVIEVISCTDTDGNEWVEVPYLAQSTVFDSTPNQASDNTVVPYVLKLVPAPRRFVTDLNPLSSKTTLTFGSGDGINFDDELIPNIADLALPLAGRRTFTSIAIDPQNFLKTRSLGLSPYNTTLTVTYRVGGGSQTNVPPASIKNVLKANLDFSSTSLDSQKKGRVERSIECLNTESTKDGGPAETIQEIKAYSSAHFAAQDRVVTREDYIARIMTMPAKFGRPEKVYARKNSVSGVGMDVYVLSRDENEFLTPASATLKKNIKTYISYYRMLSEGVNLLDAQVIDLRCSFGIVTSPKNNKSEVLAKCISVIRDYLDSSKMQIGQPIIISDIISQLQDVLGVISVYELNFSNVFGVSAGLNYSSSKFDVKANTANGILYCPENAIFELRYPRQDIIGVSK